MMSSVACTKLSSGTIVPTETEVLAGCLELKYSSVDDHYQRTFDHDSVVNGWQSLVYEAESVFRKEQLECRMVYLARLKGREVGKVVWHFDVGARNMCVDRVEILVQSACFRTGSVRWALCDARNRVVEVNPGRQQVFSEFSWCTELQLSAELSGGIGEEAWEHAQMFLQNLKENGFPLRIKLSLRRITG